MTLGRPGFSLCPEQAPHARFRWAKSQRISGRLLKILERIRSAFATEGGLRVQYPRSSLEGLAARPMNTAPAIDLANDSLLTDRMSGSKTAMIPRRTDIENRQPIR
jgi:hypothetical protein